MRWFRLAALLAITTTVIMAVAFVAIIISMCTNASHVKSMDSDPYYNNTLSIYCIIIIVQICFISSSFLAYYVSFINWRNNYQMDHSTRKKFILWLFLWGLFCLINLGVAIFAIVRGKEPQEEMAGLYEVFTKYNQDTKFIGHFERYQRENSCCGVYGPDDWLMVQLRQGMGQGAGGGGAGYQSMDYGFRQNPSTGHCHLTPPTIPMGCGRKILEELHIQLATYAGLLILQTLIGLSAACFAGYSFFYWLEKEVIVIPEDEVSNLIILEPESSTSTSMYGAGSGYGPGPGGYLNNSQYLGSGSHNGSGSRSRGPSARATGYRTSFGGSGSGGSRDDGGMPSGGYYPELGAVPPGSSNHPSRGQGSGGGGGGSGRTAANYPGTLPGSAIPPGSKLPSGNSKKSSTQGKSPTQAMLSAAGPFDANSRRMVMASTGSNNHATFIYKAPTAQLQSLKVSRKSLRVASGSSYDEGNNMGSRPHSEKHMLHKQEQALGGHILGEVHVDHKKDPDKKKLDGDVAPGKHGHKAHHATIAIVRNKKPPKPKKLFADNLMGTGVDEYDNEYYEHEDERNYR